LVSGFKPHASIEEIASEDSCPLTADAMCKTELPSNNNIGSCKSAIAGMDYCFAPENYKLKIN
jgi:hypothetical protein